MSAVPYLKPYYNHTDTLISSTIFMEPITNHYRVWPRHSALTILAFVLAAVQKFDSNGIFHFRWGGYGSMDAFFADLQGIMIDDWGAVYVTDVSQRRVQKFNSNGQFLLCPRSYTKATSTASE